MDKVATVCKKCGRALWDTDADRDGNCVDCRTPAKVEAPAKAQKFDKDLDK